MLFYSYSTFALFLTQYRTSSKQLIVALNDLYGIGNQRALLVCKHFGYDLNTRASNLNDVDWLKIKEYIELNFGTKSIIVREMSRNINFLRRSRCYKGLRHSQFLPVRGQRTKTNAQTQKNKRQGRKKTSYRRK